MEGCLLDPQARQAVVEEGAPKGEGMGKLDRTLAAYSDEADNDSDLMPIGD